jgi:sugar phosphate permease
MQPHTEVPSPAVAPGGFNSVRGWRARVFASTWLCYAGMYFCRKPFFITKAAIGEELGFDAERLGWIGFAYLCAYTIGQFVSGAVGQRIGPRRLLLGGMAISVVAGIGFGMVEALAGFALLMVVNGFGQATGWSGAVGNMANWFERKERGTVMGFWATCYQVGGVAANGMAAWVLVRYGYRYAFFAGALVLSSVIVFFFFNQANEPQDKGFAPIGEDDEAAGADPADGGATGWTREVWTTVIMVGVFYFFVKFIRYALWSWAPYFLRHNFGMEWDDAGYISTLFDLFGIGGVVFAGFVSDRFFGGRRAKVAFIMLLGMLGATACMATVGGTSVAIFGACMAATGFMLYGPDALMTGAGAMDIGSKKGAIMAAGIINGMGSVGSVVQEPLIGWMYKQSGGEVGPVLWLLMVAAGLAAASLAVVLVRNKMGLSDA